MFNKADVENAQSERKQNRGTYHRSANSRLAVGEHPSINHLRVLKQLNDGPASATQIAVKMGICVTGKAIFRALETLTDAGYIIKSGEKEVPPNGLRLSWVYTPAANAYALYLENEI